MSFIQTISPDDAQDELQKLYEANKQERGYLPNYVRAFSHRPDVMMAWGNLIGSLSNNTSVRRYELVTLAAAKALRSSYCMLAHASVLSKEEFSTEELTQISEAYETANLTPAEVAMMAYAEKIVYNATAITQEDIDNLRHHGFVDAEIFEIAATAAARCFFSKTLDALGIEPDQIYQQLDSELRSALTVGRPIESQ